jgi:hypothetical protein
MHQCNSLMPISGEREVDIWSKSDLLADPDLTAVHRWAAGQGSMLRLSKGEAGRIFLQFQPCVASDAAVQAVKCGWSNSPYPLPTWWLFMRSTFLCGCLTSKRIMLKGRRGAFARGEVGWGGC